MTNIINILFSSKISIVVLRTCNILLFFLTFAAYVLDDLSFCTDIIYVFLLKYGEFFLTVALISFPIGFILSIYLIFNDKKMLWRIIHIAICLFYILFIIAFIVIDPIR
jgi:hypothetical protein